MNIPGSFFAPAQGLENLSNSLSRLGSTFIEIDAREREREAAAMRLSEVSKFNLSVSKDVDSIFTQAEQDAPGNIDKWRDPIEGKFREYWDYVNEIDDPVLKGLVTREHSQLQMSYGQKFNDLATRKNREFGVTTFLDSFDYGMKTYLNTQDPDAETKAMGDMSRALQRAEVGGVITPELANRAKRDMETAINKKTVANIETIINSAETMTPQQRGQFVKDIVDPSKFTSLSITDRRTLWNKAVTTFRGINKEQATSAAYEFLYKTTGGNFALMGEALNDPANRKQLGLDMEQTDYLRGYISRADTDKKQQLAATYDKTAKEIFLNLKNYTPTKIDKEVRNGFLDYKTGEHFKQELKQTAEGKTDPATFDRILQDIYSEERKPEEIRSEIYKTWGLSRVDKERLLTKTEAKIEKMDARNLTRAMTYLKETVKPSETMISAAKPEEALNYLKAAEAMEAAVIDARKAGKPLSSKEVIEKAQEISQAFKMSTQEQMEAARRRIAEDVKKTKAAVKPAPVTPAPKVLKFNPKTGKLE
jgi:hypothetical protein